MNAFKKNIARHNMLADLLKNVGLIISQDVVIDTSLPRYMHQVVCHVDYKSIDLDRELSINDYPKIVAYIETGRAKRIKQFNDEQEAGHALYRERNMK